jgi:hypothetical protein
MYSGGQIVTGFTLFDNKVTENKLTRGDIDILDRGEAFILIW